MFRQEATWLAAHLACLDDAALGVVANIGSSTAAFRTREQPWIDEILFAPLARRGVTIVHVDLKPAQGVDLCVDLLSDAGLAAIRALHPRTILLCNLLEHVENPARFAQRAWDALAPGGRLFVTVPCSYPHHNDPIDTMYRPAPKDVAALIPDAEMEAGEILPCGSHGRDVWRDPRKISVKRLRWLFRPYRVTCVVLRKPDFPTPGIGLNPPA